MRSQDAIAAAPGSVTTFHSFSAWSRYPGSTGRNCASAGPGMNVFSAPAGGDFDPERDISAITVNRWNYGYAYELTSLYDPSLYGPNDEQPHVKGRRPFRNVAIANSDSGAFAYTHSAINEAYRAVQELPG